MWSWISQSDLPKQRGRIGVQEATQRGPVSRKNYSEVEGILLRHWQWEPPDVISSVKPNIYDVRLQITYKGVVRWQTDCRRWLNTGNRQAKYSINVGCQALEENLMHQLPVSTIWSLANQRSASVFLMCLSPRTGLDCSPAMLLTVTLVRVLVWMLDTWVTNCEIDNQSPRCPLVSGGFDIETEYLQNIVMTSLKGSSWFGESLAATEHVTPYHMWVYHSISKQKICYSVLDIS